MVFFSFLIFFFKSSVCFGYSSSRGKCLRSSLVLLVAKENEVKTEVNKGEQGRKLSMKCLSGKGG